jgi:hypothetical protein
MSEDDAQTTPLERTFNDDIALSDADVSYLRRQFPNIIHVLDSRQLRAEFSRHEGRANTAKRRVHRFGLLAVALAGLALMGPATKPALHLFPDAPATLEPILVWFEGFALIAAAIALGGFAIGGHKLRWLEARMMTEILRAWHFQSLIYRGREIEESCTGPEAISSFQAKRATELESFVREWTGKADSCFTNLVENADVQYVALHDTSPGYSSDSKILPMVFRAYRMLRFQHQLTYATHKLKTTTDKQFWQILKWPIRVLQDRTTFLARSCVLISLICSVAVVVFYSSGGERTAALLSTAIIILMIGNVIVRTIQDGLAAPNELERYRDYQQKTRYLLQEFDHSSSDDEKLGHMRDMERAAIEELRGFLRANEEARFVL